MSKKSISLKRGEGTFRILESGKVNYRKYIHLDNGEIKEASVTSDSEADCIKKMLKKEADLNNKIYMAKNTPLYLAMYDWLNTVKKPVLAPQSYDSILKTIKNQIEFSEIGNVLYTCVSTADIQSLINRLNEVEHYSKSTIRKTYLALNAFYKYKSMSEKFDNPMSLVVMPVNNNIHKETKEITYFSKEESIAFIKTAISTYKSGNLIFRYGPIIAANLFLGLRISELLALQWKDINLDDNIITVSKTMIYKDNPKYNSKLPEYMKECGVPKKMHVVQHHTKTNKIRYVSINDNAKELILYYQKHINDIKSDDFVMKSINNCATDISGVTKTISLIQKRAGLNNIITGTHSLRHTCASFYFSMGVPIETIADVLGNSREVCESTYVHIMEKNKREAASKINLPGINIENVI